MLDSRVTASTDAKLLKSVTLGIRNGGRNAFRRCDVHEGAESLRRYCITLVDCSADSRLTSSLFSETQGLCLNAVIMQVLGATGARRF